MKKSYAFFIVITFAVISATVISAFKLTNSPGENLKGKYAFKDFESARKCGSCHPGTYQQWTQAMMSQAYTSQTAINSASSAFL